MFRRILGLIMLLIGIIGVLLSIAGTYVGWNMVDGIGDSIETSLELTSDSLDTVANSILLTKATVEDVTDSVDTVQTTTANLSITISDTRPLLDQVSLVATQDVPNSLDAVQATLPNVAEVAGSIDDTLNILSAFQLTQSFFGAEISFDLGIDYQPQEPFDESINQIGSSLDGVPERLRGLEPFLTTTTENLTVISENIDTLAGDLGDINENIEDVQPLLDDYLDIVYRTNDLINQTNRGLRSQLQPIKTVIMILFIWVGLTQVAPLYLGWELFSGTRASLVEEDEMEEMVQEMLEAHKEEHDNDVTVVTADTIIVAEEEDKSDD